MEENGISCGIGIARETVKTAVNFSSWGTVRSQSAPECAPE